MSVKNDAWIRRMAQEHGMIEPFVDGQVREGVISYGLSSYGYDIRVTDEFKIFTNVHSAVVDPKHFNPQSFIDFKGDVCVIPPNSFVLTQTVEYFRIPRDVITVCLGKCLTGDTRIVDAETGAYIPISEASAVQQTLSMDKWRISDSSVSDFIPNGKKPVYEMTTRMGLKIRATSNHPFRQLNRWTPLSELRPGDRIAVAREIPLFGKTPLPDWEAILLGLMISEGQCNTPGYSPVFTTNDSVLSDLLTNCVEEGLNGQVSHNKHMGYRLVNKIGRGGVMAQNRAFQWLDEYGLTVSSSEKFVPQVIFTAPEETVALFLRALFSGDGSIYASGESIFLEYYSNSRRLIEDVHHLLLRFGIVSLIREKQTHVGTTAYRIQITDREKINRFAEKIGFWPGSEKQIRLEEDIMPLLQERTIRQRSNFDTLPREAWAWLHQATAHANTSLNSIGIAHTNPSQSLPYQTATFVAAATDNTKLSALSNGPIWDVVKQIEYVGEEQVYDLTVPHTHNFVANDFIVHNSTYARCFRGDTRVALVDGTAPTLEEMTKRSDAGEMFWGYSIGENGRIIVTLLENPRYIGNDSLVEVELDNGETIHGTPDHKFMLRDGQWRQIAELRPGDSLMPLYRDLYRGYEMVYQTLNGHLYPTHRLADEWNVRHGIYRDEPNTHRHHLDHERQNNNPWNIIRMEAGEHIRYHNRLNYGEDFDPDEHSSSIKNVLALRAQDPVWREAYAEEQRRRAHNFWHDEAFAESRARLIAYRRNLPESVRQKHRDATLKRYSDPEERERQSLLMKKAWSKDDGRRRASQAEIARQINLRSEIDVDAVRWALDHTGSIRAAARLLKCDRSVFRRFPEVISAFKGRSASQQNHKVIAIKEMVGTHDVYCLTVPEAGNFALESGVFVHNCGLIVNVTPFEPEWCGYVTLEISNTTPLPARIYANEGIAQVLFFQSDEVCETSYADRKGKYQGQQTIVLPRI